MSIFRTVTALLLVLGTLSLCVWLAKYVPVGHCGLSIRATFFFIAAFTVIFDFLLEPKLTSACFNNTTLLIAPTTTPGVMILGFSITGGRPPSLHFFALAHTALHPDPYDRGESTLTRSSRRPSACLGFQPEGDITVRRPSVAVLGTLIVLAIQPAFADTDREVRFEERLAEAKKRLNLSDEQFEQVKPVMQVAAEAQRSILARYGIDLEAEGGPGNTLGMREARNLQQDLSKVRAESLEKLDGILTDEQLDEFKKLQEERRQEIQKRIRAGR